MTGVSEPTLVAIGRLLVVVSLLGQGMGCAPGTPPPPSPELVVAGSHFHGIHGLTFDADDRLYAGSVVGQTIYRVDPETGDVERYVGPPQGMADDLEVGPQDQLVWTSFLVGVIHSRTGDGPIQELASGLPGINSIAFKEDGRLFATQVFLGDALYEIDPQGKKEPRKILEEIGGLNGFDFGPDGLLYGPLWFKGEVVKVDVDRGAMTTVATGFRIPAAANFDSQGRLWVLDTAVGEVVRIDVGSGEKTVVARVKTSIDNLAFDSEDRLFITNMADNAIYEIDTETGEARPVVEGALSMPGGLALYEDGGRETLYLADTFAYRAIDAASGAVTDVARMQADELEYPAFASADADHVLLGSWFSNSVQRLDRRSGESLTLMHGFDAPGPVLPLPGGEVLVAELGSGRLLMVEGGEGNERRAVAEGLQLPVALAPAGGSAVYVTEFLPGSISRVDLETGEKSEVVAGLERPEGTAVAPDGRLIVAEVGQRRLVSIDPATGEREVVVDDLPIGLPGPETAPPFFVPTGVAVSPTGTIYFSSDLENAIYRIRP